MTKSSRLLTVALVALAATAAFSQSDAQKAFTSAKALSGDWEGKASDGRPLHVSFKVTAAGSAVLSEIVVPNEDMVSMIHLDGPNRLLLTHYCAAGNQPRMEARSSPDGKIITFNYVDATNLSSPDAGHMQRMVLTLVDENHHTEEWSFLDHGKEVKEFFALHRKL
ncbi:MAG TPA: hypothetical protein VGS05_15185 [Candidatus Sulfotelmatobacter sp.]|nr:hypothetical protein [Candidatus Sulfotelmatobacter sp.]